MSAPEPEPPREPLPDTEEGSKLCTSCGLCCRALMHREAVLRADEIPLAGELGLEVLEIGSGKLRFALPCPRLIGNRCGVYERRPRACRTYQCKLLKRLLLGERTLQQGLETVRHAHELIAGVRNSIDAQREKRDFWAELKEWAEQNPERSAMPRLDAAELLVLLRREFLIEPEAGGG